MLSHYKICVYSDAKYTHLFCFSFFSSSEEICLPSQEAEKRVQQLQGNNVTAIVISSHTV